MTRKQQRLGMLALGMAALGGVMSDPENRDGVVTLISLKPSPKRAVRVNVTLPEDILTDIDRYAESHGLSRSVLIVNGE